MKTVAFLLACCAGLFPVSGLASGQPKGSLLELHSCELFAGGCIVSSEATQGGRYMLRVWSFAEGTYDGSDLADLQVALLQESPDNLSVVESRPGRGVVYLPEKATASQRAALMAWLKSSQKDLSGASLMVRTVPLRLETVNGGYRFAAGDSISLQTASLESCPTGGCGEALWYTPRTPNSVFTVGVNKTLRIAEPLLQLKWEDAGKKSVFLARFGENSPGQYVSTAEICGPAGKLF
jgi:uncharacterized protein DUF1326